MPIKWNTASGGLPSGSSPKLQPTTISGGAALNMQPSLVSPSSANVQATAVRPTEVVADTSMQSAAAATNELVKAAFAYQERLDQLEADQSVLDYKRLTREMFYGREVDGKFAGGYGTTEMKSALDAFEGYRGGIAESANKLLGSKSDSVKSKMILRIQQERDASENRGIEHNYTELSKYETNVRFQEKNDILKDIELNGPTAWTNGVVETHLNSYKDAKERQAAEAFLAGNTLFMTYNDVMEKESNNTGNLTPSISAYEATAKSFGMMREGLSEATENKLQNWLQGKQNTAKAQAKAAHNANVKRNLAQMERQAPNNMSMSISNGNFEFLDRSIAGYRATTGSDTKVMKALKEAVTQVVLVNGGTTVSDKKAYTEEILNNISSANSSLDPGEMLEIQSYALTSLPKKLSSVQESRDIDILAARDLERAKAAVEGRVAILDEVPPAGMLPENQTKFLKQVTAAEQKAYGTTEAKADADFTAMKAQVVQNLPLTPSQMRKLVSYQVNGLIPDGSLATIKAVSDKLSTGTGSKKPYQKTGGYMAAIKTIDSSGYQVAGVPPSKPPAKANAEKQLEYLKKKQEWDTVTTKFSATAKLEMNKAASDAWNSGKEFDNDKWWADYLKRAVKSGSIITPEMTDGKSWWQSGKESYDPDVIEEAYDTRDSSNVPDFVKELMYDVTGDPQYLPSVMDEE